LQFKLQSEDPYFQYYPIRTIFPALLILMSSGYFLNEKRYKYLAISIVCSLAVLWNAETGIIVLLSWIGAVVYNAPIG
jgi:predicted branched-subunit amino acid permease